MVQRLKEMGVEFIQVDYTNLSNKEVRREIDRTERKNLPVNLIYPPNYPEEPAIMLNELVAPKEVHLVLDRMQKIVEMMPRRDTQP